MVEAKDLPDGIHSFVEISIMNLSSQKKLESCKTKKKKSMKSTITWDETFFLYDHELFKHSKSSLALVIQILENDVFRKHKLLGEVKISFSDILSDPSIQVC